MIREYKIVKDTRLMRETWGERNETLGHVRGELAFPILLGVVSDAKPDGWYSKIARPLVAACPFSWLQRPSINVRSFASPVQRV